MVTTEGSFSATHDYRVQISRLNAAFRGSQWQGYLRHRLSGGAFDNLTQRLQQDHFDCWASASTHHPLPTWNYRAKPTNRMPRQCLTGVAEPLRCFEAQQHTHTKQVYSQREVTDEYIYHPTRLTCSE